MKCNEVREKLSPYLDRELDQDQMKRIEDHLNACSICLKEFELLKKTDAFLKNFPREDLPKEFHEKLVRGLEKLSIPIDNKAHKKRSIWSAGRLRRKGPWTMDTFEDFPPWSLGHVYLKLIIKNH
jgi:anti-sigma factor (TIGR02949 family)